MKAKDSLALRHPGEEAGEWGAGPGKRLVLLLSGVGVGEGASLDRTGLSMFPSIGCPSFYRVTHFCQGDKKRYLVGINAAVSQGGKAHRLCAAWGNAILFSSDAAGVGGELTSGPPPPPGQNQSRRNSPASW